MSSLGRRRASRPSQSPPRRVWHRYPTPAPLAPRPGSVPPGHRPGWVGWRGRPARSVADHRGTVPGRPRRGKTHYCGPAPVQSLHPGRATSARQNDHPAGDRSCHGRQDGSARPGPPAVAVAEWRWARSARRLLWRLPGVETGPAGSTAPRLRCRGLRGKPPLAPAFVPVPRNSTSSRCLPLPLSDPRARRNPTRRMGLPRLRR